MSSLPISHFTVDGFRGLRSLEVADLRTINLIVGSNNSGKTSVLEAVALLATPVNGNEWLQVVRRRDYGRLDESLVMSLRWCFSQKDGLVPDEHDDFIAKCHFESKGATPLRSMTSTYKEFFAPFDPNEFKGVPSFRLEAIKAETQGSPVRVCSIESVLGWGEGAAEFDDPQQQLVSPPSESRVLRVNELIPSLYLSSPRRPVSHKGRYGLAYAALLPYSYQLNTLQVGGRSDQLFLDDNSLLLDLMRQFDEDVMNIEVASFTGQRPAIYIKHKRLGVAPLSIFGDAMRRCLLLATTMTSLGRGGVLLLDEVEVGIHTDALAKVFKWLTNAARQLRVQVIATTHSLEVLDALLAAEVGEVDLAAFQLRQAEDRTECRRFSAESLKRLRYERGLDIR